MLRLPIYLSFNMPTISHLKQKSLNRFASYEIILIYSNYIAIYSQFTIWISRLLFLDSVILFGNENR